MTIIYLDESGDLGMNCKECTHFIITAVKINDDKTNTLFERIPKKIRQKGLKKKTRKMCELKFSNSSPLIREMYLKKVSELNVEVYSLIIEKRYTSARLRDNLPILYNYLIKVLLEKVLFNIDKKQKVRIFLDKCMSSSQRNNFENYIKTEFFYLFKDIPDLQIMHENSRNNNGLQVTDFICGAFGYKYNTIKLKEECEHYTSIIKHKIKIEKNDLFKNIERKTTPAY